MNNVTYKPNTIAIGIGRRGNAFNAERLEVVLAFEGSTKSLLIILLSYIGELQLRSLQWTKMYRIRRNLKVGIQSYPTMHHFRRFFNIKARKAYDVVMNLIPLNVIKKVLPAVKRLGINRVRFVSTSQFYDLADLGLYCGCHWDDCEMEITEAFFDGDEMTDSEIDFIYDNDYVTDEMIDEAIMGYQQHVIDLACDAHNDGPY